MGVEDDQVNWRIVFCKDPTNFQATTWPEPGQPHTVVQPDPADLKCTVTPDGVTSQEVSSADPDAFAVKTYPEPTTPGPVVQAIGVRGIWPAPNAARINKTAYQDGAALAIIYTVPANKKFYMASSILSSRESADAVGYARIAVRNDTDVFQYTVSTAHYYIAGQKVVTLQFLPALEAVAGWDVFTDSNHANVSGRAVIHGWLEDA